MARISKKQQKERAEQVAHEMAHALDLLTKPMRTKRIQRTKTLYNLINDDNGDVMSTYSEYTEDLAIMCAMRELSKLKRQGMAPSHASLIIGTGDGIGEVIQGFRRTNQ